MITTPYNKSLSAFTVFVAFEHASSVATVFSGETPFAMGTLRVYRNGTTANSWYVTVGTTTVGPFTLATDGTCTTAESGSSILYCTPTYVALVVRWDGTKITVYSSLQIPKSSYSLPLTTLASGTNSTAVSGVLYLGAATSGLANPFQGTLSNFLIYPRALSDPELVHNMGALRTDMLSRGITLP